MDQAKLKELLNYDPATGVFTWAKTRKNCNAGSAAGSRSKNGYIQIRLEYKLHYAHRLAWIYCFGFLNDDNEIDHVNADRSDNRIANLRIGTHAQNMQNLVAPTKASSTGLLGVTYDKSKRMFTAQIKKNKKCIFLGRFRTAEAAAAAYVEAKRRLHEFCTI